MVDEEALDDVSFRIGDDRLTPLTGAQVLDVTGAQPVKKTQEVGPGGDQSSEVRSIRDRARAFRSLKVAHETKATGPIGGTIPAAVPSSRKRWIERRPRSP